MRRGITKYVRWQRFMNVLISGDSHIGALRRVHDVVELKCNHGLDFKALGTGRKMSTEFFEEKSGFVEITDEIYRKNFKQFPPDNDSYDVIGIAAPFHTTRVWRDSLWSEFKPWCIDGNRKPLSDAVVLKIIEADVHYVMKFIKVVSRNSSLFIIEAPKPFRHHSAVKSNGSELVSYIDGVYRQYVKRWLEDLDIPVLTVEPEWYDSDGFMLDQYRADNKNDMHHGNLAYGRLMLNKVESFLLTWKG